MSLDTPRRGDWILLGDDVRIVKRVVLHPAGTVVQWIGGDSSALSTLQEIGAQRIDHPLTRRELVH